MDYHKIDLHMHSTVSDGTDTPPELLAKVREKCLWLFALTDHDAIEGCNMIRRVRTDGDPRVVSGVEFSCRDALGKYHILGYDYDPDAESIRSVVALGHGYRMKKLRQRLDFIDAKFGFAFPEDAIQRLYALNNPGKPHIGNMMVEYGYAPSKEVAIKQYLNQVRFSEEYVRPEEAIRGILDSGGVPVLAHPAYGSGDELIVGEALNERLRRLIGFGLQGVEGFYSTFPPKLRAEVLSLALKYDLYVTAGSDYHGSNKMISLGDTTLEADTPVPEGLKRFIERLSS